MITPVDRRYHVPRSQVWAGSRGRQTGNIHLHVRTDVAFGRIRRKAGASLCGKRGWYERELYPGEEKTETFCPRCVELLDRLRATPDPEPLDPDATMVS